MKSQAILQNAAAAMLLGLASLGASAAPIAYNFSGTLTDSFGSLSAGDAVSGSYTIDPAVPGSGSSAFSGFNNLLSATLTVGGFSASIGPGVGLPEIQQDDVAGADRYGLLGRNPVGSSTVGGLSISAFGFRLDDTTGTAISNALTLLTNPALSNFTSNTFLIFFGDPLATDPNNFHVVSGVLNNLSPVPEPASLALFGVGACAARFARRRPCLRSCGENVEA
jgi:hypothetical protein